MAQQLTPPQLPVIVPTGALPHHVVAAMVASGSFVKARRGALTPSPGELKPWQQREHRALASTAAVCRKLSEDTVVSHASAALVHGLWLVEVPLQVHVTRPSRPNGRGAPDIRRHRGVLSDKEVTRVGSVRATTIERTILDCARTLPPRQAAAIVDSGMRVLARPSKFDRETSDVRIAAVRAELLRLVGRGPGHGRRQARALIQHADPYVESAMESVLRWIVVAHGLPVPTAQLELRTPAGRFFADLGWRWRHRRPDGTFETRTLLVEYDGVIKYLPGAGLVDSLADGSAVLVAEKRREDAIREQPGTTIVRVVHQDLATPEALVATLSRALPAELRATIRPVLDLL